MNKNSLVKLKSIQEDCDYIIKLYEKEIEIFYQTQKLLKERCFEKLCLMELNDIICDIYQKTMYIINEIIKQDWYKK